MKKGLVAALSGLCILSTSLGIVACTSPNTDSGSDVPVSITTLTPEFEYHVGDNVHMFDHFSYVDGLTYTFTVQYEDEEAVTVEGDAYYLAEAGNYKITCEASNGKESKKESVTITVGNEKAFIQFKNREAQVDWKKIMWDTDIIALADPITIVDCEYETYIESVVIYDAADGSGRTVVIEDGVKIEDDAGVFYNGNDKFTFVYECDYVFTIVCETSGGKVSDKLTVSAKENFDSLQVLSDYSASYNADTFTANWDAVTGASSYYVKVDRKQMVTEETTVNIESLIVSDFQYFDLYIVPLDSEGNRLGKIICEDIVIAPEGAEGIVKGPGASIDVAAKKATLVGYQAASAGYESGIRHVKNSYIAYGYKYGVGTYVDFTFTGNNMPQVCFFANEVNGNMTCHSGSIHQSAPNEGYLFMNGLNVTGDVKGKDSFICVGPYRFGCKDHGNHINYTEITEGSTKRFIISKNSLFTYNGLEAAGSDKEYIYTVGSFTSGGCLAFELILRDADTQEVLETARIVTAQSAATVKAGHIIAYAGVKGNGTQTTFGYGEPYQGTPLPVYEQGVMYNEDGSVTLDGKASPGSYVYHVAQVDNSYVSIQGEYGLDTYIDINFKGNNMPQVLLFADQINGNMTSMGGKGVLFSNGLVTANPAGSILRKYSIYGPNRIYLYGGLSDTDKVVKDTNTYEGSDSRVINNSYWTLLGYDSSGNVSDYPFLTQKGLATTPDTEYKYTLGMYEKDGIVYAHIELYDVTNDVEVYNFEQATTLNANDLMAGNIILYGSVAGATTTTTFSYSEPYTKTQEEPENPEDPVVPEEPTLPENVEVSGATFNDNGSVTLEGKAAPGSYVYHIAQLNNSYVALKGTYGLDTYIDITFTGNNMPQVLFFADQINGNMTSMGGKGVLFSNGLVTANPAGSILRKYAIYGPNRIYLYGGITDSDKVVQNTNTYEGSDSRVINNANRILLGYDASGNVSDYPFLTQQGLATTPDVEYKYTLGLYEKDGVVYAHIELYDVTNDVEVYNFDQATTLNASDLTAGNIILYGSVASTANTTTFSYSEPYKKTQEEPEEPEDPVVPEEPTLPENVEASGATFNDDGSVTLEGKVTPGGYVYHIAQIDNSYVALKGEYGLNTYIDITFKGNNMPQVLFFADQINGNMTSMGGKGVLFSHGIANAGMNQDFLRKYYIFGPNRITLHGGITDADKQVIAANWYETSDSRVINNANKLLIGYDSSGNASDYPYLTQKGLATTPDTEYKYTLGLYEKDGVIYAHIELYDVTNDVEVYNFDQATTLSASDLTAGNIILYGSVAGTANTTTFSYSEPYTKTQEEPEVPEEEIRPANSGATFNDDGSVTLEGKAAPGSYVYHVAQMDNSYVAIEGEYGLGTYIDITFKGNNMPQVMFFADQINGNMTSMGGKGVLFSNGLSTANPAGSILRKYAIYGPNRIYLHGGITDSDKVVQNTNTYEGSDSRVISNTNKILLGYDASGNVSDYPYLTQKGLATTPDTEYRYTLGMYEKDGVVYAHIELYNLTNDVEVYNFDQATTLSTSDLTAGSIILYGSVAGTANTTTFSYSKPYTKEQA